MMFSPDWLQWYDALDKPAWAPPPATVGLIWQVLYPIKKSFARTTELSDIFKKNMAAQTYYELLGVSYDADEQEIRRAYHQKIKEQHPDQNPNDPRAIRRPRRLNEARENLTNK